MLILVGVVVVLYVAGLVVILVKFKVLHIYQSGMRDYLSKESLKKSKTYREKATSTYRYLGITGSTLLCEIGEWMKQDTNPDIKFYFLLLDTNSHHLERRAREKHNFEPPYDTPEKIRLVTEYKQGKQKLQEGCVNELKATRPGREGRIEFRKYSEYPFCWMEIMDDETILAGLLSKEKSGINSPLMVLRKSGNDYNLFSMHCEMWQRIWENSNPF